MLKRTATSMYVIGKGQAELVAASPDHLAQEALGTVVINTGHQC